MFSSRLVRLASVAAAAAVSLVAVPAQVGVSSADVPGSAIVAEKQVNDRRYDLTISSPSMGGDVKVTVLSPSGDAPRPSLYMLDGAGAGVDVSDWITKGGAEEFFADKNVNAVLPAGGAASFYTNWLHKDKKIGRPQWETFLTEELPPLIDARFHGTGGNGVMGLSMGGQSAFTLITRHPDLYRAVASLSGCPTITGSANEAYVTTTVKLNGGDASNMWGQAGGAYWRSHDPQFRLDALRGKTIYLESGSGRRGEPDRVVDYDPKVPRDLVLAIGSGVEIGADRCTREFATSLRQKQIGFTLDLRSVGTHRWEYWKQGLPRMWKAIESGL
ncbi:hypothetical protein nbrc107696_07530 [Gordonia spumicola]|uniref:Esterase n=1 Tax=Gordonia spumicola TaxID=589161 RepID=A0A7I9V4Y9_9ACTN|nr:alpha/beta hydrolase family protein [Gordonia spumicola]GEE00307.1 hypothetical protein nbrc107696_07530 [Gordonia spumicola]